MGLRQKWRFRLIRSFFGLSDDYMEKVYEQLFTMKYHGGWSIVELYSLPIGLRNWFANRLKEQFEKEKEEYDKAKSKSRR